jgi:glycosyltransferase involved in cell wall biosynthesis
MRTKELLQVPGVPLKEAMDLGEYLERVILIHFHKRYTNRSLSDNVRVITIPYLEPRGPVRFAASILTSYLLSIPILTWLALKYKINLFRSDDVVISGFPIVIASRIVRNRCIISLLGDVEEVVTHKIGNSRKRLAACLLYAVRSISRFTISNSDASIVVNRALEKMAKSYNAKKVVLTHPNVDLSLFIKNKNEERNDRHFTVLFVGRLEPEKGPMNLLKVAEILRDINFVVAGYGSLQPEMERTIAKNGLTNVKLLGLVDHKVLPKLYRSVDLLLLPSYSEGMPVVMLEAMASELPVVVSKVGAVGEILEGNNGGFSTEPGNISEIVSKINLLRNDVDLRMQLGKRAKINVASRFQNFVLNHVAIYRDIMSGRMS